jgi:hypothetical protein
MNETSEGARPEGDEPSAEEREQLAQEGRLKQTEQEEKQEDE